MPISEFLLASFLLAQTTVSQTITVTATLDSYVVADLFASHRIAAGVDATLAIENVFDEPIEVGATPVVTLGQPRVWRIGVRYRG